MSPPDGRALADELAGNAREIYFRGDDRGDRHHRGRPAPPRDHEVIVMEFPASLSNRRGNQTIRVSFFPQRNGVRVWSLRFYEHDLDGNAWPLARFGMSIRADLLPFLAEAVARALRVELGEPIVPPASNAGRDAGNPEGAGSNGHNGG